jgi:hypothetical protein
MLSGYEVVMHVRGWLDCLIEQLKIHNCDSTTLLLCFYALHALHSAEMFHVADVV